MFLFHDNKFPKVDHLKKMLAFSTDMYQSVFWTVQVFWPNFDILKHRRVRPTWCKGGADKTLKNFLFTFPSEDHTKYKGTKKIVGRGGQIFFDRVGGKNMASGRGITSWDRDGVGRVDF